MKLFTLPIVLLGFIALSLAATAAKAATTEPSTPGIDLSGSYKNDKIAIVVVYAGDDNYDCKVTYKERDFAFHGHLEDPEFLEGELTDGPRKVQVIADLDPMGKELHLSIDGTDFGGLPRVAPDAKFDFTGSYKCDLASMDIHATGHDDYEGTITINGKTAQLKGHAAGFQFFGRYMLDGVDYLFIGRIDADGKSLQMGIAGKGYPLIRDGGAATATKPVADEK